MSNRVSRIAIFGAHISTAVIVGLAAGLIYFAGEVMLGHEGKYLSLGQPLMRILAIYLATVIGGLVVLGVLMGFISALTRRGFSLTARARVYVGSAVFALSLLWVVRNWSVARFAGILFSSKAWIVVVLALAAIVAAWVVGRALGRFDSKSAGRAGLFYVPGIGVMVLLLFFSSREVGRLPGAKASPTGAPNVVMIVLDALRADHLSCYGYDRVTSPRLDELAAEGVTFLDARSSGNRTILAMPALFTSLYPSFNGAMGRGKFMRPLGEDKTTIAEMLQARGYTTLALMTNIHVKSVFGMTQGFAKVEEFNAGCYDLSVYRLLRIAGLLERPDYATRGRPDAKEITDHALAWLNQLSSREPFFLYVHYMDTHHPYRPPPEYADLFGGISTDPIALFDKSRKVLKGDYSAFTKDDLQTLRNYYDACIRYSDHEIGRIIDRVRGLSDDRETIFVVTADHGDEFLEHGTLYHNNLLIESLTKVPLIISGSSRFKRGLRVESLVRHIDVMPTLAQLADANLPQEAMGKSLVPLLTGAKTDLGLAAFAEGDHCTSYVSGDWKVTYVDSTNQTHLYNLRDDPMERKDLSKVEPERMTAMSKELFEYRDKAAEQWRQMQATTDEETLRQLKALGYIN